MNGPALLPSPFSCNEVCWQRALLTGGRVFGSEEFVGGGACTGYGIVLKVSFPPLIFPPPKCQHVQCAKTFLMIIIQRNMAC